MITSPGLETYERRLCFAEVSGRISHIFPVDITAVTEWNLWHPDRGQNPENCGNLVHGMRILGPQVPFSVRRRRS